MILVFSVHATTDSKLLASPTLTVVVPRALQNYLRNRRNESSVVVFSLCLDDDSNDSLYRVVVVVVCCEVCVRV